MLLLRGFFRKKKIKVYVFILCALTISVILLFSVINYCETAINVELERSSVILVISKNDYYDVLKTYSDITEINRVILLKPDYGSEALKANIIETKDEETGLVGVKQDNLIWSNFLLEPVLDKIIVYSNSQRPDLKLKNNQIAFSTNNNMKKEYILKLIGERISLSDDNDNLLDFFVSEHYDTNLLEMTISDEMFQNIINNSNSYVYDLKINNHQNLFSIEMDFRQKDDVQMISHGVGTDTNNYFNMAYILNRIVYVVIAFLFLILLTIIRDIIKDEKVAITLERLLGYSIKKIRKITVLKVVVLIVLVETISLLASLIVIILLNSFLNINILLFNYSLLLYIYTVLLSISIFLSYISQLKSTRYITKIQ